MKMLLYVVGVVSLSSRVMSEAVSASIDVNSQATDFQHYWKKCTGSGHMLLGTRVDWREHLTLANKELGITGIRGHGLLDDDMSVMPRKMGKGATAEDTYEFYNVDQVFDFLMTLKMKPVVELSFMPKALVSCGGEQNPCSYAFSDHGGYKGLIMPPDDFGDWYALVNALAHHLVDRYGLEEVNTWHFEVWNELWGIPFPDPYMKLYNASAHAIKDCHESLKVGGPATMQTQFVGDFIDAVKNAKDPLPVDFISTHFYPTDPECQTPETVNDPDCFAHTVLKAQALAAKADLPFFITEYNNGLGGSSRDDASAAAFVIRNIGLMEKLDMFSWWTFSDVFEEQWMLSAPFHNGFGMMTMHGVRKPVWRAFEMLTGAGIQRLAVSGHVSPLHTNATVSVLATRGGNSTVYGKGKVGTASGGGVLGVQVYVANYYRVNDVSRFTCDEVKKQCRKDKNGNYTDYSLCSANCKGDATAAHGVRGGGEGALVGDCPAQDVTLTLTHSVDQGKALGDSITVFRIDANHSNPMAAWMKMGSPKYPTTMEIEAMSKASALVGEAVPITRVSPTSTTVSFHMPPYSVLHFEI